MVLRLYVLIETLWNVKGSKNSNPKDSDRVLIETLWNVKSANIHFARRTFPVLIETLWNVKILVNGFPRTFTLY